MIELYTMCPNNEKYIKHTKLNIHLEKLTWCKLKYLKVWLQFSSIVILKRFRPLLYKKYYSLQQPRKKTLNCRLRGCKMATAIHIFSCIHIYVCAFVFVSVCIHFIISVTKCVFHVVCKMFSCITYFRNLVFPVILVLRSVELSF